MGGIRENQRYNSTVPGKQVILQEIDESGTIVDTEKLPIQSVAADDNKSFVQNLYILLFMLCFSVIGFAIIGFYNVNGVSRAFDVPYSVMCIFGVLFVAGMIYLQFDTVSNLSSQINVG